LLAKSDSSNALRRHHKLINQKTLKCRSISHLKVHSALTKWNMGELGQKKIGQMKNETISARLEYFEQILRTLEQRANPKMDPPNWMAQMAENSPIPSQFMAEHQPKGIFPANRRIQRERKAAAAVQQLIGRRQIQSFAIPSSVDLHRMRVREMAWGWGYSTYSIFIRRYSPHAQNWPKLLVHWNKEGEI
jgi:hypothetical protein